MPKPPLEVVIDDSEVKALVGQFRRFRKKVLKEAEKNTDKMGVRYRAEVIRRSSGRPGPRKVTGQYHQTIRIVKEKIFLGFRTSVVSDHPAGPRLEEGFDDTDSLGRVYHQPPFPHWRPATEAMAPKFAREQAETMGDSWRESK